MNDGVKSALIVNQNSKKSLEKQSTSARQIEYKQVSNMNDYIGELSDQQKEVQFHKQHQQYMKMKVERKKQLIRLKREEFGTSSSQDNDDSSEQQIQEMKGAKRVESKRSKGKLENKGGSWIFSVLLQTKKSMFEKQLTLSQKSFQLNDRSLPYQKITKLSLFKLNINNKLTYKVRIGIDNDDTVISINEKYEKDGGKIFGIFEKMFSKRIQAMNVGNSKQNHSDNEDFGQLKEGALIYDKIFKKSQVLGKWEERYIIIRPEGLFSYRSLKQKPTMQIPRPQITELLTSFQPFKDTIVIKLIYNNNTKTDFGLPVTKNLSWLQSLVKLLK